MKIPFTPEEFLDVFKTYNESVFPLQIFFNLLAIVAIYFAIMKSAYSAGIISLILTFLWLWMGFEYHLLFFSEINNAAYLFGSLFIIQGILFFYHGSLKNKFSFNFYLSIYSIVGIGLIIYSLIGYPILGYYYGHRYPFSPTFGLPCPTTIFTFGILLLNSKKISFPILIIPIIWSIIGFSAALNLGFVEDTGLIVASILSVLLLLFRHREIKDYREVMP
jgi:hypothetical protein